MLFSLFLMALLSRSQLQIQKIIMFLEVHEFLRQRFLSLWLMGMADTMIHILPNTLLKQRIYRMKSIARDYRGYLVLRNKYIYENSPKNLMNSQTKGWESTYFSGIFSEKRWILLEYRKMNNRRTRQNPLWYTGARDIWRNRFIWCDFVTTLWHFPTDYRKYHNSSFGLYGWSIGWWFWGE